MRQKKHGVIVSQWANSGFLVTQRRVWAIYVGCNFEFFVILSLIITNWLLCMRKVSSIAFHSNFQPIWFISIYNNVYTSYMVIWRENSNVGTHPLLLLYSHIYLKLTLKWSNEGNMLTFSILQLLSQSISSSWS